MRKRIKRIAFHAKRPWHALWSWMDRHRLESRIKRSHAIVRWSHHRHARMLQLADLADKNGEKDRARKRRQQAETYAQAFHYAHSRYQHYKREWDRRHRPPEPDPGAGGISTVDGRTGPTWIAKILLAARAAGAWSGTVTSFGRTREYSQSLCYGICGAPSCPGTCAGVNSNHACPPAPYFGDAGAASGGCPPYEGAVDALDYYRLEAYCRTHNLPLYGGGYALGGDLVHFSRTGR